jgi:hypothetical protein
MNIQDMLIKHSKEVRGDTRKEAALRKARNKVNLATWADILTLTRSWITLPAANKLIDQQFDLAIADKHECNGAKIASQHEKLQAEHAALQADYATLQADYSSLQAEVQDLRAQQGLPALTRSYSRSAGGAQGRVKGKGKGNKRKADSAEREIEHSMCDSCSCHSCGIRQVTERANEKNGDKNWTFQKLKQELATSRQPLTAPNDVGARVNIMQHGRIVVRQFCLRSAVYCMRVVLCNTPLHMFGRGTGLPAGHRVLAGM